MHCKLKMELQVVGTLGNSFPPPGKILSANLYLTLDIIDTPHQSPGSTSQASHPSVLSIPSPQGWTLIIFLSTSGPASFILFPNFLYNHLSKIQIQSCHSQMHILRWFPSIFYIKSDILLGHLRPFTFGLCFQSTFCHSTMMVDISPSCSQNSDFGSSFQSLAAQVAMGYILASEI